MLETKCFLSILANTFFLFSFEKKNFSTKINRTIISGAQTSLGEYTEN